MSERKPLFVECMDCGERWKVATLPAEILKVARSLTRFCCPFCGAKSDRIGMCATDGPDAVAAARDGKAQVRP